MGSKARVAAFAMYPFGEGRVSEGQLLSIGSHRVRLNIFNKNTLPDNSEVATVRISSVYSLQVLFQSTYHSTMPSSHRAWCQAGDFTQNKPETKEVWHEEHVEEAKKGVPFSLVGSSQHSASQHSCPASGTNCLTKRQTGNLGFVWVTGSCGSDQRRPGAS